jgi:hypothetical protein
MIADRPEARGAFHNETDPLKMKSIVRHGSPFSGKSVGSDLAQSLPVTPAVSTIDPDPPNDMRRFLGDTNFGERVESHSMTNMRRLLELKQSVWLDYLRRGMTRSGELQSLIGLRGMTSNASITSVREGATSWRRRRTSKARRRESVGTNSRRFSKTDTVR